MTNNKLKLSNGEEVTVTDLKEWGEKLAGNLETARGLVKTLEKENKQLKRLLISYNIPFDNITLSTGA